MQQAIHLEALITVVRFQRMLVYFGEDDYGNTINKLPENSRYIKSEDILYEIKKIQQKQILSDGMEYDYVKRYVFT